MARSRNLIWVAVAVSIALSLAFGVYAVAVIRSPVAPADARVPGRPWVLDAKRPWLDQGPRGFDYGTVPFVPAKGEYSNEPVAAPPLPNPAALRPRPATAGRSP